MKLSTSVGGIRRLLAALAGFSVACAAWSSDGAALDYGKLRVGSLSGKLIVQWMEPDIFLFLPDVTSPLTFKRANGQSITPGRMLTDGGSIPRPLWILRNYSPWGFAPAFIIHDWIFEVRQCKYAGADSMTFEDSAEVMAEIMKTMIEAKRIEASSLTVQAMHAAVSSSVARNHWNGGKCNPPPAAMFGQKPLLEYRLEF